MTLRQSCFKLFHHNILLTFGHAKYTCRGCQFTDQNLMRVAANLVAFMHVPKTAGTAVAVSLRAAIRPERDVFGWDLYSFGHFRDFATCDAELRHKIFLSPEEIRDDADFVCGHISLSTLRARFPQARCLTILREPISRLLSLWLYMRSHEDHALAAWGSYAPFKKIARQSLAEFLTSPQISGHTDNALVRMLLWPSSLIPDEGYIQPTDYQALLHEAVARLSSLAFVDVTENGDMFANLGAWLGLPVLRSVYNETAVMPSAVRSPLARELTSQAYDFLTARSCLDKALWCHIVRHRMPGIDPERLQTLALLNNVARLSPLMDTG